MTLGWPFAAGVFAGLWLLVGVFNRPFSTTIVTGALMFGAAALWNFWQAIR